VNEIRLLFEKAVLEAPEEDKDDFLHMLIVEFKNELEAVLHEFQKQHGGDMQELNYYTLYLKLQRENINLCDLFTKVASERISYKLNDKNDPRNLIKRCNYCKEIWFKTEGCDGMTTCGNSSFSSYFDQSSKPFWKFTLKRTKDKLEWSKVSKEKTVLNASVAMANRFVSALAGSTKVQKAGCGRDIKWSDLPKVEDELIFELFKVKTIEAASKIIEDERFKESRQNYEATIDCSFHS